MLVTHNLPLCYEVADRVVVLNRGSKVADVRIDETESDHIVGWITGARPSQFAADPSKEKPMRRITDPSRARRRRRHHR